MWTCMVSFSDHNQYAANISDDAWVYLFGVPWESMVSRGRKISIRHGT